MLTPDLLVDLALLSSLSVLVHYFFGLYGILAAIAGASLVEHGAEIAAAALDRVSRCGKSEIAKKAAGAVDTIRRRRPTRVHGVSGDDATWRSDESSQREEAGENSDDGTGDGDPRALLEQFATASPDEYEQEQQQQQQAAAQRDDLVSEESAQSADDLSARLVIRDVGSRWGNDEDHATIPDAVTDTAEDILQQQRAGEQDRDTSEAEPPSDPLQPSVVPRAIPDSLMQMNSREPIAFETELFKGHAYFLVRTRPEDPHWMRLFLGRRRMFWIQVQGQFKRAPQGTVYLGGELPAQISPGIFTRSIAHVIMGIIQQLVGSVNFSFGDLQNEVLPSIALPLYQSADQLIVTPAGEQPPPLGERDFGESDAARRLRRQTPVGSESYVVGATYSFDFHTMYVDLTQWRTANLPGLSEMELSTFFDSLPLRMVAYDVCATPSERHLQTQKDYLFNFEVQYDRTGGRGAASETRDARRTRRRAPLLERTESGNSEDTVSVAGVVSTDGSGGMSTVVSEASSIDDQTLVLDEVLFLNQENARRLAKLSFSYLCWLEEVDVATGVRRVHYVFAVKRKARHPETETEADSGGGSPQLAVVSAYALRVLLLGHKGSRKKKQQQTTRRRNAGDTADAASDTLVALSALRFHSQSRIGSYSTISDEAFVVAQCLQQLVAQKTQCLSPDEQSAESFDNEGNDSERLPPVDLVFDEDVAFLSSFYQCLTQRSQLQAPQSTNLSCSPSKLGVNLSKREREDMRVVFEGVVYRYYAESLLRQEVLFVTPDELLFYRSYSTSAEKHVACSRVIGVQAVKLPGLEDAAGDEKSAFVFTVSTFAEEIVLCVGTEHARKTWIRVILQHCQPQENFDRSLRSEQMHICYAASKPLKPASRINLNARALFPQRQSETASLGTAVKPDVDSALRVVKKTLRLGLQIHSRLESVSVVETLEFLNAASALRTHVDLDAVQRECSHEAKLAFYLNLYHAVLAHAMIAHGFPRSKSHWDFFLTHMCYSVGVRGSQVSLSLAEIEHAILRNRMPQADVPHLNFGNFLHSHNSHSSSHSSSHSHSHSSSSSSSSSKSARLGGLGIAHPDFRLIFALAMNQQDQQDNSSSAVVVFEPEQVHDQLNAVAQAVLRDVAIEKKNGSSASGETKILLPRICEWYRLDFGGGGSPLHCVRKLLGFLNEGVQHCVLDALEDPLATRIKFQAFKYAPRARLQECELHEGRLRPVATAAAGSE